MSHFCPYRASLIDFLFAQLPKHEEITPTLLASSLTIPGKSGPFELTLNTFHLAKILKKPPQALAKELEDLLLSSEQPFTPQTAGPYLNLSMNFDLMIALLQSVQEQTYFSYGLLPHCPKTMIEYSQPNTHKEMHVGHMRNVCLGQALEKIYKYCGLTVLTSTYPGDMGTHVAKCLWYLDKFKPEKPTTRLGAWLGTIYSKAHNLLEEDRGSEKEAENRAQLTKILQDIHSGSGHFFTLWQETRTLSIELMKEVYAWLGVSFDYWYFESEVDRDSITLVKKYLEKKLFTVDAGAVGMDLAPYDLGFCLLLKSDGQGLYATKDLELARKKFQDFNIEKSIYIVDSRQSLHFKQVFKTLELMEFPQAKNCLHLGYEMVELPSGPMSSRKGNIVPILQLIDEMESTIRLEHLAKYTDLWTEVELSHAAKTIANAAIKYGMLKIDPLKKIIFDLSEWLNMEGNTGPYLLYTYARFHSVLQKVGVVKEENLKPVELKEIERSLVQKIFYFNDKCLLSFEKNSPSILCHYLYELCQDLNSFYANSPITKEENLSLKIFRVNLTTQSLSILKKGLHLLGIDTLEKM
jgi:arginyl-tRNA synthetase